MSQLTTPAFSEFARFAPLVEAMEAAPAALRTAGLAALRRDSLSKAVRWGFPTTRQEEWRYTSLEPLSRLAFKLAESDGRAVPAAAQIAPFLLGGDQARRLVFIDGMYAPSLSAPGPAQAGLRLGNLAQCSQMLVGVLDGCAGSYENAMGALNTAFFRDGACVHLSPRTVVAEPIHLLFLSTGGEAGWVSHLRNVIIAGPQSQACIIESYACMADGAYVTNSLTELTLGAGAQIEHARLEDESAKAFHFGAVHARQDRDSGLQSHSFALGARMARNDLRTVFTGENAQALLNGLYVVGGARLVDHHTVVDHAQPHCESHEFYNGILDERGRGVFNGKIFVRPGAQKTNAKQTNRNLLLSSEAVIDTKPQLEIFADDVKCTHGATVGQLDEDAVFYLQSRGIDREEARRMLIRAFARVVVQRVKFAALRPDLDRLIVARLGEKGEHDG